MNLWLIGHTSLNNLNVHPLAPVDDVVLDAPITIAKSV